MTNLNSSTSTMEESNAPVNQIVLRNLLVRHFNLEEIKDMCFELQFDYENVPSGKNVLIRELILQLNREERLVQLITIFRKRREHIALDKLYAPMPEKASTTFWNSQLQESDRQHAETAEKSLQTLALLANNEDAIRDLVIQFRTNFESTTGQIDQISKYKKLHDLFQELETTYYLIDNDQNKVEADDAVWDSIELLYELELREKINELIAVANTIAEEVNWIGRLEDAHAALAMAVSDFNIPQLKRGTKLLYRVISQQLSRINVRLVNTAELLQLEPLQTAIITISDNTPAAEQAELQKGADAFKTIQVRMDQLVVEHNAWQQMDDDLRLLNSSFTHRFEDLKYTWPDLVKLVERICANRTERWAIQLLQIVQSLTQAIEKALIGEARSHFRRFRSRASHRFRKADLELLGLCTELQKVGHTLHNLLENV